MKLSVVALAIVLLLGGCDAWPTVINNRSSHPILIRYHQQSYIDWSAIYTLKAGEAQGLAREHWIQDIISIQIMDASRNYIFSNSALEPLRHSCESRLIFRRLKFTPDCFLTYKGNGTLSASFDRPKFLVFRNLSHGH